MEFSPSMGQWIVTLFAVWLAYWTYKSDKEESQKRKEKKEHEKALLEDVMFLTTTRVKFERHLWSILDKVASYKIQRVIITDEKEIPQSVLLPYAEYQLLQECYDRQEAQELAPLIQERLKNNANKDDCISHEEMVKFIDEKRAKKQQEEKSSLGEKNV
ncbi:MAG: hypothetical protein JXK50_07020 [Campylobacterales bacterium]|nr:hypothetical protein [Campylobacterales bacterium]